MAFTYYTSNDASGPGVIKGVVGDLNRVLRACLVTGYSGKTAAGWTEPMAESTNKTAFKQGANSTGFYLYLNDNAPVTAAEAYTVGWETMSALDAPVGVGTGQFPTPAQSLTNGHLTGWKSSAADATGRAWKLYADSRTMYLFVDWTNTSDYGALLFGDIVSHAANDLYRCIHISSGSADNYRTYSSNYVAMWSWYNATVVAHYIARSYGGGGGSLAIGKQPSNTGFYQSSGGLNGFMSCPNPTDNSVWLNPLYVHEAGVGGVVRGRMRGLWVSPQPYTNFTDGQTIQGAGDLTGRTFQAIRYLTNPYNAPAAFFVETSDTLDT